MTSIHIDGVWLKYVVCCLLVLVGTNSVLGDSRKGLGEILRNGDMSDPLFKTLRTMETSDNSGVQTTDKVTIKPEQLKNHIRRHTGTGNGDQNVEKPSVGFMIGVFEHLLEGEDMPHALGHTDTRTMNQISTSDTIRSYTAISKYFFLIIVEYCPVNEH